MKQIASVLSSWGPLGIFLLAILDSAGVPLPAAVDALVVATAALHPSTAYIGALFAIAGSLIGCMFLYYVGRKGGRAYLDRATATSRTARFRAWFNTYGLITVFIPAFLPIPLPVKVAVLCSGALGVRLRTFLLVILAARVPRYFALAWLGLQLGDNAVPWLKAHVWHLTGVALGLGVALTLVARWNAGRIARERRIPI